jgi:hypothetical protein
MQLVMQKVHGGFTISYSIHDGWSETLTGIYFLLKLLSSSESSPTNIEREHLARISIVSSHHLIEIMFFRTVERYIRERYSLIPSEVVAPIKGCLQGQDRIGIYNALREWPKLLLNTGAGFDFGKEPFQSQELLREKRNRVIHYRAESATFALAAAAYYTTVKVSESREQTFFPGCTFTYQGFVSKVPPMSKELFAKAFSREA